MLLHYNNIPNPPIEAPFFSSDPSRSGAERTPALKKGLKIQTLGCKIV